MTNPKFKTFYTQYPFVEGKSNTIRVNPHFVTSITTNEYSFNLVELCIWHADVDTQTPHIITVPKNQAEAYKDAIQNVLEGNLSTIDIAPLYGENVVQLDPNYERLGFHKNQLVTVQDIRDAISETSVEDGISPLLLRTLRSLSDSFSLYPPEVKVRFA